MSKKDKELEKELKETIQTFGKEKERILKEIQKELDDLGFQNMSPDKILDKIASSDLQRKVMLLLLRHGFEYGCIIGDSIGQETLMEVTTSLLKAKEDKN